MNKAFSSAATLVFAVAMSFQTTQAFSQTTGNEIIGTWWNQEKEAQIEIYRTEKTYSGKIVWLKETNDPNTGTQKLDKKNPDTRLRTRPIQGSDILYGLTFDIKEKEWNGGTIYDAREGKSYKCYLKLNKNNTLKVRGYMGAAWMGLGKTNTWTKVN